MSERVLVIGAHCDDESFGCLGTLLKHKEAGDKIEFLAFTSARNTMNGYIKCSKYFDSVFAIMDYKDQEFDTYTLKKFISDVECWVKSFKPTLVYFPFIGDLNRDHRIVSEATMVACRPYKPNAPKECWMYPIRGTTELGLREFKIDRKEKINIEEKVRLINLWYPGESINGRQLLPMEECFERWPRI